MNVVDIVDKCQDLELAQQDKPFGFIPINDLQYTECKVGHSPNEILSKKISTLYDFMTELNNQVHTTLQDLEFNYLQI